MSAAVSIPSPPLRSVLYLDIDASDDGLGFVRGLGVGLAIVAPFWAGMAWIALA